MTSLRLKLRFQDPSPSHCGVAVFVNKALAGNLVLRQEEIQEFKAILMEGTIRKGGFFETEGNHIFTQENI